MTDDLGLDEADDTFLDEADDGPLRFLKRVMEGTDPRQNSALWECVQEIEADNLGEPPDAEQWETLLKIVEADYKPCPVPLEASQRAAATLAEYKHSKRKSIEFAEIGAAERIPDLSEESLDEFEEWFNGQF